MNKFQEKLPEQLLKVHYELDLQLLGYRILFTIIEIKIFFLKKYRLSEEVAVVLTSHLDYFFLEAEESNIYLLLFFFFFFTKLCCERLD